MVLTNLIAQRQWLTES